ncbi:hypothetical protein COE56_25900 [Bacillus anthracis]|nr:hypothetical protein COE56_25900 [Bacillus anthracis]
MRGICVNDKFSTELRLNQEYYLFSAKPHHFYVSRFNNINASFGCYESDRFQVIEDMKSPEEPRNGVPALDKEKYYHADLVYVASGYQGKALKNYVVQPSNTHCYFWHDVERKKFGGCFPLHWFSGFVEIGTEPIGEKEPEIELFERIGGQLAFF